jgi:hypothetical protein
MPETRGFWFIRVVAGALDTEVIWDVTIDGIRQTPQRHTSALQTEIAHVAGIDAAGSLVLGEGRLEC